MLEEKKVIGLLWEPKLPSLLFGSKSGSLNVSESSSSLVYKATSELIDGQIVPSNNPKKVNKLLKKQVKDTTGKSCCEMLLIPRDITRRVTPNSQNISRLGRLWSQYQNISQVD